MRIVRDWSHALERASVDALRCNVEPTQVHVDLDDAFEMGLMTEEQFIEKHLQISPRLEKQEIGAVLRHWLIGMYEGAGGVLGALRERGVSTACLSNTNAAHWRAMEGEEVFADLQLLDRRFASHLIGLRKPAMGTFEHVEIQMGVDPGQVVFFDDNQDNCIAADRRGWRVYQIDPDTDPPGQMREHLSRLGVL